MERLYRLDVREGKVEVRNREGERRIGRWGRREGCGKRKKYVCGKWGKIDMLGDGGLWKKCEDM